MYYKTYAIGLCLAAVVMLQAFIPDLAWGVLIAVILSPIVTKLEQNAKIPMSRGVAIAIAIIGFLVMFIVPLSFLMNTLGTELMSLSKYLMSVNATGMPLPPVLATIPYVGDWLAQWWAAHLALPGGLSSVTQGVISAKTLTSFAGTSIGWIASHIFHLFLAFLAAAIFLANEAGLSSVLKALATRAVGQEGERILATMCAAVRATALGLGSVALLEGVVLGMAYSIAGAPYPVMLGILTVYMAMIPGGAPLSFTAVSAILLAMGQSTAAIGVFSWGSFELFMVDKFIRPKLIGNGIGLPFLAVLFGLLGGVTVLGPIGLFIGPMLMALVFQAVKYIQNSATVA